MTEKQRRHLTVAHITQIKRVAVGAGASRAEIASELDLSPRVVNAVLNDLHTEKMVHIAGWADDSRGFRSVALFKWGAGVDAPRQPRTKSSTHRVQAMRLRNKTER